MLIINGYKDQGEMNLISFYSFEWKKMKKLFSDINKRKMFSIVFCKLIHTVPFEMLYWINIF